MLRYLILLFLLISITITVPNPVKGEVFTATGLVDIPTGRVLQHGIFEAGTYLGFQQGATDRASANLADAVAVRLDFGLFDRLEVGLTHLWNEAPADPATERTANLKLLLLKEPEAGIVPGVAIGIEKLGNKVFFSDTEAEGGEMPAAFLAVSKTFNLPRVHLFSLHVGVGTQRFAFEEQPIGVFAGLSKAFQPAFARGDIATLLAFDGSGVNAGLRYITSNGLQVALGAETLNNPDERRYLASVSWTNEKVLEEIEAMNQLIIRATALVVETKRAISEKKATDKATETPPSQ